MNWRAIFAIVRKDLKVVLQNKGVVIPIIALPLILLASCPGSPCLSRTFPTWADRTWRIWPR